MWDPLRTRAIPERLRGVYTTRRYTNPRLPYLTLPNVMHIIAKAFLSVCLSVKRVDCDKTKENCAHIRTPHERSFIIIFRKKNGWWWATHYTWNFWSNWPCWSENADFQSIFACSASAVTPSEKSSINTNSKSTTRVPMSLRWTSYVAPIGAKNAKRPFSSQNCTLLKEVCYKVCIVNTVSNKVVRHSLAYCLSICAK